MNTLREPRLLPVVELLPFRFLDHLEPPKGPWSSEDEPFAYWKASLAASGFESMEPIWPGSYLVPLEQVRGGSLDALIAYELSRVDLEDEGLPLSLDGGYILYDGPEIEAHPQCCANLKDLADWLAVTDGTPFSDKTWIGIGHPGLAVTLQGENLLFESGGPEEEHIDPFLCSVSSLRPQVSKAREAVLDFRRRLEQRALISVGVRTPEFCDGMVGRLSEAHDDGWS